MKWLVVGVWLIGVYSVLYYIEIKTSVVEIPQTIILERNEVTDEWKTSIKDSEYRTVTKIDQSK